MKHDTSTFLSGCAPFKGFFFFAKELDALAAAGTPNSSFFSFDEDDTEAVFRKYDESVGWPAISMATTKTGESPRLVVAIGPNGDFWEVEAASATETVGAISGFKGNLRKLAAVDGRIYACGMGRAVLRRESVGRWTSFSPGEQQDDPSIVGFEDIGGHREDEMYAVGWGGEIWWRDHGTWRRVDSPTSTKLTALHCAADGNVYVVGQNGTMLRGKRDRWESMRTGCDENLMGVSSLGDQIYVCTDFRILRMTGDGLVDDRDFSDPKDLPRTCLHLLSASDGLVALGQKDVYVRGEGPWSRLV